MVRREIEDEFPNMSLTEIEFRYKTAPKSGGSVIEVRYHTSDKWYRLFTQSKENDKKTLNTGLPKQISQALGKSTTESINETSATLKTLEQQEKAGDWYRPSLKVDVFFRKPCRKSKRKKTRPPSKKVGTSPLLSLVAQEFSRSR